MSIESAKAFLSKVEKDEDLQEQLQAIDSDEKFFEVVHAAGFDFTREEWWQYGEMLAKSKEFSSNLTEADLLNVSGGGTEQQLCVPGHCGDTSVNAMLSCGGDGGSVPFTGNFCHQFSMSGNREVDGRMIVRTDGVCQGGH